MSHKMWLEKEIANGPCDDNLVLLPFHLQREVGLNSGVVASIQVDCLLYLVNVNVGFGAKCHDLVSPAP